MAAEPTPTQSATAPARLRSAAQRVRGALRRPLARRALVVGGLALAGWLLGAGNAAQAADTPPHQQPTISNPVNDQVGQAGGLVHTGSDAVNRTADSLNRSHLGKHDGEPSTSDPVRQKVGEAGGLVHTGSDAVNRTTGSLDRSSMAKPARENRLTDGIARRSAGLRPEMRRIAEPVTSLLHSGTTKVDQALPVRGALNDPSTVVDSVAHDVRPGGHTLPVGAPRDTGDVTETEYGKTGASSYGAARAAAAHHPGDAQRMRATGTTFQQPPNHGRGLPPRLLCAHDGTACGHGSHPSPHAPAAPAPTGPESDTHGLMPSPVSGQSLPGAGDFAWGHLDRTPRHLATVAPRRGVLPPVVRTAADEPALSPD